MKTDESNSLSLSLRKSLKLLFSHKAFFKLALIFFFAGFLFLGGAGRVSAATIYVSVPGGTYAAGNNTDGSSWTNAYTSILSAVNSLSGTTDDEIILDPTDDFSLVYATRLEFASPKTGGSVSIHSENNDPANCFISGDSDPEDDGSGNWYLFRANDTGVSYSFRGITFRNHKRTDGGPPFLFSQLANGSTVTWSNLRFTNIQMKQVTNFGSLTSFNGLIRFHINSHAWAANFVLQDIEVDNIAYKANDQSWIY